MKETSLKPVIEKLESLFSKFNEKFYNNELQTPVITVSPDTTKGAYGCCNSICGLRKKKCFVSGGTWGLLMIKRIGTATGDPLLCFPMFFTHIPQI